MKERFGVPDNQLVAEMRSTGQGRIGFRHAVIYGLAGGLIALTIMIYRDLYGPYSFGHQWLATAVIMSLCLALGRAIEPRLAAIEDWRAKKASASSIH